MTGEAGTDGGGSPDSGEENQSSTDEDPIWTVAEGAGFVFGGRVVKITLAFVIQIVMARLLGTTFYGSVVLATTVTSIAGTLGGLGIGGGLSRKLPLYEVNTAKARGVVRAGFTIGLLGRTLVALGLIVVAPLIATRVFNDPNISILIQISALGLPLGALAGLSLGTTRSLRDARPNVLVQHLLNPITKFAFIITLLLAGFGAVGAVAGRVLSTAIGAIVAIYLLYRLLPFSLRGKAERMHHEMLEFSLPLMLSSGMVLVIGQIDTFLLGVFLASGDVGVYNAAFNLQELGFFFLYPVSFLLPPVLTRLQTNDEAEEISRTYQITTKWMSLLTLPLFLLGFLFPEVVINVSYGPEFVAGESALRVLMLAPLVSVLLGANGNALVALGHNKINMYVNGSTAGLNIALNLALIPTFGILGAAIASAGSFIFRDVVYTIVLYWWHDVVPFSKALLKPALGVALISPLGYYLFVQLFPVRFLTVTAVGIVFLVFYLLLLLRLGAVEDEDVRMLHRFEESAGVDLSRMRKVAKRLQRTST